MAPWSRARGDRRRPGAGNMARLTLRREQGRTERAEAEAEAEAEAGVSLSTLCPV